MENLNIGQRSTSYSQETSESKVCWICLSTDDDYENNRDWVSPCKCRGSSGWVHQDCVLRWIDEKLKENLSFEAHCPQCRTQYIFVYKSNYLAQLLNMLDRKAEQMSPFLAVGVEVTMCYWSAACYGILTIIQVMGKREAITMMENTNPFILLLVLPTIPFFLIYAKVVNFEEIFMILILRFTSQLPLFRTIMPSFLCEPVNSARSRSEPFSNDNPCTLICAGLLLPTNAVAVGNLLFRNSSYSCLRRTLLGGLVYIAVKGLVRIYQRQQNLIKERTFRVIEYPMTDDEND